MKLINFLLPLIDLSAPAPCKEGPGTAISGLLDKTVKNIQQAAVSGTKAAAFGLFGGAGLVFGVSGVKRALFNRIPPPADHSAAVTPQIA